MSEQEIVKTATVQVRAFLLGEFVQKILDKQSEGYVFDKESPYRIGRQYITDLTLGSELNSTQETPEGEKESGDSSKVTPEIAPEIAPDTVIPDWDKLDNLVKADDKDGLEDYCKAFGIDLNKRKSSANMLKEFKVFVGA